MLSSIINKPLSDDWNFIDLITLGIWGIRGWSRYPGFWAKLSTQECRLETINNHTVIVAPFRQLYWLPVQFRLELVCLTYKKPYNDPRSLFKHNYGSTHIPPHSLQSVGIGCTTKQHNHGPKHISYCFPQGMEHTSSSDCSKLRHCTGFYKSNRGPVPTGEFSSLQFHCFRIIRTKSMTSSVENFLNRSYPRFASTTTTTSAHTVTHLQSVFQKHLKIHSCWLLNIWGHSMSNQPGVFTTPLRFFWNFLCINYMQN